MSNKRRILVPLLATALVSCSANPGPAPVEKEQPTSTTTTPAKKAKKTSEIAVGIDPINGGLNPHILADDSTFVRSLASLVLPSSYVDGELNSDLLESVDDVPPPSGSKAVQTIRYKIRPEAQWSDATPITVSDFEYLWHAIVETPGALGAPYYRAIGQIRSADGGRTVEVDLAQPLHDWRVLFNNLLPSHVLRGGDSDFSTVLADGIPASAGRYSFAGVDRQRGIVTLNRNDRFWGEKPATVENIKFREVTDIAQGRELLRTGQIKFLDITPTEVAREAFELMPNTQVRTTTTSLNLQLIANTHLTLEQRADLQSLIDVHTVARIAMGRSTDLGVGDQPYEPHADHLMSLGRPVRIGVDPSDPEAQMAARVLSDVLARKSVKTQLVETDTTDLIGSKLAASAVDAIITWSAANAMEKLQCAPTPTNVNIALWCDPDTDQHINDVLSGAMTREDFNSYAADVDHQQHLTTVIAPDTRLLVLGTQPEGKGTKFTNWPMGLTSIGQWSINEE